MWFGGKKRVNKILINGNLGNKWIVGLFCLSGVLRKTKTGGDLFKKASETWNL